MKKIVLFSYLYLFTRTDGGKDGEEQKKLDHGVEKDLVQQKNDQPKAQKPN